MYFKKRMFNTLWNICKRLHRAGEALGISLTAFNGHLQVHRIEREQGGGRAEKRKTQKCEALFMQTATSGLDLLLVLETMQKKHGWGVSGDDLYLTCLGLLLWSTKRSWCCQAHTGMETSSARLTAGMISRGRPENLDFFFLTQTWGNPGLGYGEYITRV